MSSTDTVIGNKPKPFSLARLKKEEDEDFWISGEELHTDGSDSDEVEFATEEELQIPEFSLQRIREAKDCHRRISAPAFLYPLKHSISSEPSVQDEPHLSEIVRRFSEMGLEFPLFFSSGDSDEVGKEKMYEMGDNRHEINPKGTKNGKANQREEEVENINEKWRPKKGSIKIPEIEIEAIKESKLAELAEASFSFEEIEDDSRKNYNEVPNIDFRKEVNKISSKYDEIPTVVDEIPKIVNESSTINDKIPTLIDETPKIINEIPTIIDKIPQKFNEISNKSSEEIQSKCDAILTKCDEISQQKDNIMNKSRQLLENTKISEKNSESLNEIPKGLDKNTVKNGSNKSTAKF